MGLVNDETAQLTSVKLLAVLVDILTCELALLVEKRGMRGTVGQTYLNSEAVIKDHIRFSHVARAVVFRRYMRGRLLAAV